MINKKFSPPLEKIKKDNVFIQTNIIADESIFPIDNFDIKKILPKNNFRDFENKNK